MIDMPKDYKLHNALQAVREDAGKQYEWHEEQLEKPPLRGWSEDKRDEYHNKYMDDANKVAHYCFVRMMQIDPD